MTLDNARRQPRAEQEKKRDDSQKALLKQEQELLTSLVREQVVQAIGSCPNLFHVQVRFLWECHFRANVFLGNDAASARIGASYFLTTSDDGKIMESIPQISIGRPVSVTN